MGLIRALLLVLLALVTPTSHLGVGARILCIESDGCISLEDPATGCCAERASLVCSDPTDHHPPRPSEPALDHESCDSCLDVLIESDASPTLDGDARAPLVVAPACPPLPSVVLALPLAAAPQPAPSFGTAFPSPRDLSVVRRC